MAHYTNHTFNLTELMTIEQQKEDYLDSLNIKLSDPALQVKDLALMLKSLEIMDNMEHLTSYKEFIVGIAAASAAFVTPNELIDNGGLDKKYLSDNLVQNAGFESDSMEIEICKQSGFDGGIDLSRPWENGIAYKFDTLVAEGTTIVSAITDGLQTAVATFDVNLKPNTQYKMTYDLHVNNVDWDLPYHGKNLVDVPSEDTMIFSETGGGPDPVTYVVSVMEDEALVLPTCDGVVVPFDNTHDDYNNALPAMALACTSGGGVWFAGELTNPNTQQHNIVPYTLEAREGDTIIFTNPSTSYLVHNAVSDDNISFTSPDLNPGENWTWVVDGYHDLYFHCTFHPLEEGRLLSKTNHRYVYNVDHGLNAGDTVKIPVNYGTMVPLANLSTSYYINIPLDNTCTSIGGAGTQTNVNSLYHDLSINDLVAFQSGAEETDPDAAAPVDVVFSGENITPAIATATISGGVVSTLVLGDGGTGYQSLPSVSIQGGGGYGATADIDWEAFVSSLTLANAGAGYLTAPTIDVVGGNPTTAMAATVTLGVNVLSSLTIDHPGSGYTSTPVVTITGGGAAASATAEAVVDTDTGLLKSITIIDAGDQYTSAPTVTITGGGDPLTVVQALVSATIGAPISSVTLVNPGSGYKSAPNITLVGGEPVESASILATMNGSVTSLTLTAGGIAYGSATGGVTVGERQWEDYVVTGVVKGSERIDVFLDDANQIGHVHQVEISPADYVTIKTGTPVVVISTESTGHTHTCTFSWDPAGNLGAGALVLVGMTGGHTHGMDEYYEISGGTKVELVNFGHYHEILINEADEATLKADVITGVTQDIDGTWSHDGAGTTIIRTSDFGTSDPQHFHTVEFGCIDAANDLYIIIEVDQHIHDFGRVWYPGSSTFQVGQFDAALGGDDLNPSTIAIPFTDIGGFVKKQRGIICADHGLYPGTRIHYTNVYNGVHHGNTNYWIANVIDKDSFVLTETVVYPLSGAPGTTPATHDVIEEYTVIADLASYRFQVERDITNHIGSAYVEGVQITWSRPNVVSSPAHGLAIGDVVQLPSGNQPYTPSELVGAYKDHVVVGLGDGYGPTEHMEITVHTNTTITYADPDATTVEGAQDSPWLWSWWDHTPVSYAPYQRPGADEDSFGGNDGTNGGFVLHRGGTYKFTNEAWSPSGHMTVTDPVTGNPQPMYMHAAGIKAIPGAGWDNLVTAGFEDNDGNKCVSLRADHGLTLTSGDHNPFVSLEEDPGTWTSDQPFPVCMGLGGWCEELDASGWFYNGVDDKAACEALNPGFADVGLAQWEESQYIGNFSKEFTWTIPEDFGLSGSDGSTGLGPFVPPGEVNGYYAVESYQGLYKFDKEGMIEGTNRTLNLYRGGTYRFRINAAGHPFYVTTDDGSHFTPGAYFGEYTLGVDGSRAEEGAGDQNYTDSSRFGVDGTGTEKYETLTFTVPEAAPDTLYYQCAWHGSMVGTLNIIDVPVTNAGEDIVVYFHHGQDNMYTPIHIHDKIEVDNGTSDDYFQVQPTPENAFPVAGTIAHNTNAGNLITAEGLGIIPKIQAMDIELGSEQAIDAVVMEVGESSETFVYTNDYTGDAKLYVSLTQGERSSFSLSNVDFEESPWNETGSFQIEAGTAFTVDALQGGTLEQLVTGSVVDGGEYEIGYEIIETFRDSSSAPTGTFQVSLVGDTTVEGIIHTTAGTYTQTIIAPVNTTKMVFTAVGIGKVDSMSLKERVTGQNAWYFGEGWVGESGTAAASGSIQSRSEISQTVPIEAGKLYEVSYNLSNTDPESDGPQGRLQLALGSNPYNLISNWNFDAANIQNVNWSTSSSNIAIVDNRLVFTDATGDIITYTFAENLNSQANYEVIIDVDKVAGTIHQFYIDGMSQHNHTTELTEAEYQYLKSNADAKLTSKQTDGTHADLYEHTFTLNYTAALEVCTFVLSGEDDPLGAVHTHDYSCDYDNYTKLINGTISELNMSHLTQTDVSHPHAIVISWNGTDFVVVSDDNEDHVHVAFATNVLDSGIRIVTQTFWEGHDDIAETGTTTEISDIIVQIGEGANLIATEQISSVGIHTITMPGTVGNTLSVKAIGSGIINSVKFHETQVDVLDHHTTGVVNEGEQKYFIRAGDYDSKIHFVGDIDKRPEELHSPFFYSRGFKGSIDDVSIKLVEENWTFASETDADAYIQQDDGRIITSGTGPNNRGIAHINFPVVENQHYKVYFNVDQPTDSIVKVGPAPDSNLYGELLIAAEPGAGLYESRRDFVFKADATGVCYLTLTTTAAGFTYWDNVSVKDIPNLSSDEYLLLGRALNVFGMPIGGEERWKQQHLDKENEDYTGQVLTGFRTMESYGENIIEQYYDVALRSDNLLDSLNIVWYSHEQGYTGDVVTIEGTGFKSGMTVTIGGVAQAVTDVHIPTLITFVVDAATPLVASDIVLTTLTNEQFTVTDGFTRIV